MSGNLEVHVLASGSDGNSLVIRAVDTTIMIDAGLSGRRIERLVNTSGIDMGEIDALLLTHEHSDHTKGAGVLSRKYDIPVYASAGTFENAMIGRVYARLEIRSFNEYRIGDLSVVPLPVSHHAGNPNGFSIKSNGHRCLVATDLGVVNSPIQHEMRKSDIVVIESNHDEEMLMTGPYPAFLKQLIKGKKGHLSNRDCAAALSKAEKTGRKIFLAHLSKNNNTPELALETAARSVNNGEVVYCLEPDETGKVITI